MKRLVEDVDSILAREVGEILPRDVEVGAVELDISGIGVQEVKIVSTPGRYGGFLRWFLCPGCGCRVGRLCLPTGKCAFLCRHCYNLGYRAQYIRAYRKPESHEFRKGKETLKGLRKRFLDEFRRKTPEKRRKIIKTLAKRLSKAIGS